MGEKFIEHYIDQNTVPAFEQALQQLGFLMLRIFKPNGVIPGTEGITSRLWVDELGNRVMVAEKPGNPVALVGGDLPAGPIVRDEG